MDHKREQRADRIADDLFSGMMVENGLTERHLVHGLRRLRCERPEYFHPERSFIFELQSWMKIAISLCRFDYEDHSRAAFGKLG